MRYGMFLTPVRGGVTTDVKVKLPHYHCLTRLLFTHGKKIRNVLKGFLAFPFDQRPDGKHQTGAIVVYVEMRHKTQSLKCSVDLVVMFSRRGCKLGMFPIEELIGPQKPKRL